jgi:hypothetical protein
MKRYAILIGAAASIIAVGAGSLFLARASAVPGPAPGFGFIATHNRPIGGRPFIGVVVVNRDPARAAIRRVRCDAQVGNQRLRGRQRRYFAPPYKDAADIACSWRIPADARGEKLRLWNYRFGRRVDVLGTSGFAAKSQAFSWLIKP